MDHMISPRRCIISNESCLSEKLKTLRSVHDDDDSFSVQHKGSDKSPKALQVSLVFC